MEEKTNETKKDREPAGIVHVILSQSYTIYFLAVVLGVVFDLIFPFNIFSNEIYSYIGLIMIIIGSIFVYWAQATTSYSKTETKQKRNITFFSRGPYKYTRNPTNFGVAIMSLGLGFIINSPFSIIFIVVTYLISKFIFIKMQEDILKERYGDVYEEYRKQVKDWI